MTSIFIYANIRLTKNKGVKRMTYEELKQVLKHAKNLGIKTVAELCEYSKNKQCTNKYDLINAINVDYVNNEEVSI